MRRLSLLFLAALLFSNLAWADDSDVWSDIQHRAGVDIEKNYILVDADHVGDVLGDSIPFVDDFLGPLADHLDEVAVTRAQGGIVMTVRLDEPVFFPIARDADQKSTQGSLYGVSVAKEVTLTFHNAPYLIKLEKIKGLTALVRLPIVGRLPGVSDRVALTSIEIDTLRQRLKFRARAMNNVVKLEATVDLKERKFDGVSIWATLGLNGSVIFPLLLFFPL